LPQPRPQPCYCSSSLRPGPTGRLFLSCSSWPVLISVWFNLNGQCGPNPRATVLFPAMRARCGSFGTLARHRRRDRPHMPCPPRAFGLGARQNCAVQKPHHDRCQKGVPERPPYGKTC
jgi:hypothetical protein